MNKLPSLFLVCVALVLASGCGNQDTAKAEKVINAGLAAIPECANLPIESPIDFKKVGADGALGVLKAKGYIIEGKVTENLPFVGKRVSDAFVLTEKGKPLVHRAGDLGPFGDRGLSCLRTGHFHVSQIEAVDVGNSGAGQLIANVRVRIRFVPEQWVADTTNVAAWSAFWKDIKNTESAQWLYPLLKSGDTYYWQGAGHKLN